MKNTPKVMLMAGGLLLAVSARAAMEWEQTFTPADGTIQAGNMVGQVFSGDVTVAPGGSVGDGLVVALNITGGYNGDFYAYLVAPNGTTDLLLNEPGVGVNGFGASGSGMDITLADNSPNGSIQYVTSSEALSGSYQPDSPLSMFNSSPANGDWTLFFADEGSGGGNATLDSWSLGVTAIPEVASPALYLFFGTISVLGGIRWLARRNKIRQTPF